MQRNVSGVLLLDKPYGITSNKALQKVKRLFGSVKSGHTGTLDPMATGMLPICIGEATKFASMLLNADKTYEAVIKLGFHSTTGDAEGEITQVSVNGGAELNTHYCETVVQQFIGKVMQMPPMHSALKYSGKPLYHYARQGRIIERKPRTVNVYSISVKSLSGQDLTLSIKCGTGTYIRVLAEDIGKALGCGSAYLTRLRRHSINSFSLPRAKTLEQLESMSTDERVCCLMPIDSLLHEYPFVSLNHNEAHAIRHGRELEKITDSENINPKNLDDKTVRLYYREFFLGLGVISTHYSIKPKRLLSNAYLDDQNGFLLN